MQKIFIKHVTAIMTAASFLILFINFLFYWHMLEVQQFTTFHTKIDQVIHTLENNRQELSLMKESGRRLSDESKGGGLCSGQGRRVVFKCCGNAVSGKSSQRR